MGKIKYNDLFLEELEGSFHSRKKELMDFYLFISSSEKITEETLKDSLEKSYVLLLYANWEGFIKETLKNYFLFIIHQKRKLHELSDNFYQISFKYLLKNHKVNSNIETEMSLLEKALNKNRTFSPDIEDSYFNKYILGIENNLKIKNYDNICKLINHSYNDNLGLFKINLKNLVHNRNSIAHTGIRAKGDDYRDIKDIEQMKNSIITEMENFKNFIILNIKEKKYLS